MMPCIIHGFAVVCAKVYLLV